MKQAENSTAILVEAQADSSQTMVKLCKNGNEWLSPTGWSQSEKSTLLDSEIEGNVTRFTIPDTFAASINAGDKVSLKIPSLSFEQSIVWAASGTPSATNSLADIASTTAKRGLFGRFGGNRKVEAPQQSEVERLAEEARAVADASSAEMLRAQEAKQAAELRALEAARLAEAAHKMEQARIQDAERAKRALAKAEAAKLAEEKRIEAERLAEEAKLAEEARLAELARIAEEKRIEAKRKAEETRLAEEARLAERARREEQVRKVDEERRADIKQINAELLDTKEAIRSYEDQAQELSVRAKKAKEFVKSQGEIKGQAKRTFEMAERKVSEGETGLAKRMQIEQTTKDELQKIEKALAEQQKLAAKTASAAQKAKSALADAEIAAQAAAAKAEELRAASQSAQDEAKNLQSNLGVSQQQAQDIEAQKTQAETARASARATLEQVRDTLGVAKGNLKDASSIHAEAGNALRQTDGLIADNQSNLETARDVAKQMRARVKHLKAQKITPDNVDEVVDILKMDTKVSSVPFKKAAALASGLGGAALVMEVNTEDYSDGVMSKFKGFFSRKEDEAISDKAARTEDVSADDNTPAASEKKIEQIVEPETIAKPVDEVDNSQEPAVKLVSETEESDLKKFEDDANADDGDTDNESGLSRKAVAGLSAVLLLSVASIGVIASNASRSGTTTTASTEKTRINTQAVLPATITAQTVTPIVLPSELPTEPTMAAKVTLDAKGENLVAATEALAIKEPTTKQTTPVLVANIPNVPAQKWGEGTVKFEKTAEKKPVKVAVTRLPKKRRAVRVTIPAATPKVEPRTVPTVNIEPVAMPVSQVTKDVQTKLATLGFYAGEASGKMDDPTIAAMNQYQQLFGLEINNKVTASLLNVLNNTRIAVEPLVPEPEIVDERPTLEASLTPAEVTIATPVEAEPELAPELIVDAKKTKAEAARYPNVAQRRGHNKIATVIVSYDVDANGIVLNAMAKESSGVGRFQIAFEKAAVKAAEKAIFSAKTVDGKAVTSEGHETKFTFNVE